VEEPKPAHVMLAAREVWAVGREARGVWAMGVS
jgi:hypothetical protein